MNEDQAADVRPQRTIRMFPDYAHTVLWISMPVDYEDTGLSDSLVAELEAWEQFYYDSLDSDFNWVPESAARTYTEEGARLARLVAAEVGPQFVVEFSSYEHGAETVHLRAENPAQNPTAEAAFTQLFDEEEAEWGEAEELRRNNPGGKRIACAPLSGAVFDPDQGQEARPVHDEDDPGRDEN